MLFAVIVVFGLLLFLIITVGIAFFVIINFGLRKNTWAGAFDWFAVSAG